MANGSWLDPNINAWWLDRSSPNDAAASAAFGRGMQVAQQRLEMMQQSKRDETMMKFKMLDFMLEGERNELAIRTFKAKQDQDILRTKGMAEIGNYLSEAIKNQKLTDPSTQAGFYELTSKYAPFIDHNTVNSMWDNNFGNAMRREDQAKRIREGSEAPAVIQYQERLNKMESDLAAMSDPASPTFNPTAVEAKKKEIERFRIATRLVTAEESTPMALAEFRAKESEERAVARMAHEKEMAGVRSESQKSLQGERFKRAGSLVKLKTELKAVNDKYDLQILNAFNDQAKKEKLIADRDKELESVWQKYNASFGEEGGAAAPSTTDTNRVLIFDPSDYKAK